MGVECRVPGFRLKETLARRVPLNCVHLRDLWMSLFSAWPACSADPPYVVFFRGSL